MPKRPITAEDLLRLQFVGDPQMSPDGGRVLFTKKHINDHNKYVVNLFSVDMDGKVSQWTQGEGGAGCGRWSPDGTKIAFVSGREGKLPQIFVIPTQGGEAKKLTSLDEGSVGEIKWSPNGKYLAFSYRPQDPLWTEKAKKEREEKGLSTPPRMMDNSWYRLDGDGYFLGQRHALYIVDVETGEVKQIFDKCPSGLFSFCWSPNSGELAVAHSEGARWMFEPENSVVTRVDLEGQLWKLDGLPVGHKDAISWSPDGRWLSYFAAKESNDWGTKNERLFIVSADGGTPTCLTPDDDFCLVASTLSDAKDFSSESVNHWSPDSKAIYVQVPTEGSVQLGYVPITGGLQILTSGKHVVAVGTISTDGERVACLFGDPLHPNEVAVYDLSAHDEAPQVLTKFNREFLEDIKLSEPEEVWLESTEGAKVHVWVMKPIDYLEPKRYPTVLEIHGGPHAQYGWAFFHEFQVLAAEGYVVTYSNPRGSKGYGEAHCEAIRGDWGNRDWDDVQAVMRWMQHQPYIHPGLMGVMGGSYGGYMTNWVIGHTNDFRAAITDRCVSNLISMGGSSDFMTREDNYWPGVFYGNIEKLWKDSPIAYFKNAKTPTLIIHSEGDLRCNVEQGEQVFMALQAEGIESRFVRYPQSTFHGLSRSGPPDLRIHRLGEILAWWQRHLKQ